MSGGVVCKCPEAQKPAEKRNWGVFQRNCNHSAFNGGRYAYSAYSSIGCKSCRATWRTTANYVTHLKDYF